jgi:hypothetical protein
MIDFLPRIGFSLIGLTLDSLIFEFRFLVFSAALRFFLTTHQMMKKIRLIPHVIGSCHRLPPPESPILRLLPMRGRSFGKLRPGLRGEIRKAVRVLAALPPQGH